MILRGSHNCSHVSLSQEATLILLVHHSGEGKVDGVAEGGVGDVVE